MKRLLCGAVVAIAVLVAGQGVAKNTLAPKEIGDIMKEAHGGGMKSLRAKVIKGEGSSEEAKQLLALYEDLAKNEPPRGDKAAWKKKTETILVAAKKVAAKPDDTTAAKALGSATACMACHKDHKP